LQTAAMVDITLNKLNRGAPVLIIAPLSTLAHWQREFRSWTNLNAIVYHGTAEDRRLIREKEFVYECDRPASIGMNQLYLKKCAARVAKGTSPWMVNVVITSPEMMICDDTMELSSVMWEVLIVDEAHRYVVFVSFRYFWWWFHRSHNSWLFVALVEYKRRLKNHKSKLANSLRNTKFEFRHRVLLTG
jgi:SNF2 family DNA or RNA helicase